MCYQCIGDGNGTDIDEWIAKDAVSQNIKLFARKAYKNYSLLPIPYSLSSLFRRFLQVKLLDRFAHFTHKLLTRIMLDGAVAFVPLQP